MSPKYSHSEETIAKIAKQFEGNKYKVKYGKIKPNGTRPDVRLNARRDNVIVWVSDEGLKLWKMSKDARRTIVDMQWFKQTEPPADMVEKWKFNKTVVIDAIAPTIDAFIAKADKILDNYKIVGKKYKPITNEFVPFGFNGSYFERSQYTASVTNDLRKIVALNNLIRRIHVKNVVGIAGNGKLDPTLIAKPDETPWFYFDCTDGRGAAFAIISNGEQWYPVNRKTEKLTSTLRISQDTINPSRMTTLDCEIVQAAIKYFLE